MVDIIHSNRPIAILWYRSKLLVRDKWGVGWRVDGVNGSCTHRKSDSYGCSERPRLKLSLVELN